MRVPVAVWQPCRLLYTCYLLTYLRMAQLMPMPLTVSCFSKVQIGFTFLVPTRLGNPGQRAVIRVCVCVCVSGTGSPVFAAYCYRRAAVAWSVHPRGILLLGLSWINPTGWPTYRLCLAFLVVLFGHAAFSESALWRRGVVVSGVRPWCSCIARTKLTHVGRG